MDPLAEKTMDAYGYCYQNPLRFIDPDGRNPRDLKYAAWARRNPLSAIADGFRQMFDAAFSLFSINAGVTITKTEPILENSVGGVSANQSLVTESKAEVVIDGSNIFKYDGQNIKTMSEVNPVSTETSTTSKTVSEIKGTITISGVPVNLSQTQEMTSTGEAKSTSEVNIGLDTKHVKGNAFLNTNTVTNSDGTTQTVTGGLKGNVTIENSRNTRTQAGAYLEIERK